MIAYEALTGEKPFAAGISPHAALQRLSAKEPDHPTLAKPHAGRARGQRRSYAALAQNPRPTVFPELRGFCGRALAGGL